MALGFPTNPNIDDLYTVGNTTYQWNGTAWAIYSQGSQVVNTIVVNTLTVYSTSTINGAVIITTATLAQYLPPAPASTASGITILIAGTDTVIATVGSTSTIWNNSTLESVTLRGATTDQAISITNPTDASNTSTGALTVVGGVGIGGSLYAKNTSYVNGSQIVTTATIGNYAANASLTTGTTTTFFINNITNSISTTTGALIVAGGAGIGEDVFIGGNLTVNGITDLNNNLNSTGVVTINNSLNATSTSSAALVIEGGVGIGQDLWIGGSIYSAGQPVITTSTFYDQVEAGTDILITATMAGVAYFSDISTLDSVTSRGSTTTHAISITNTQNSTNTTTGALHVAGGVGIGGDVNIGGSIQIQDAIINSSQIIINSTTATVIDSYSFTTFRSSKYLIQIESGAGYGAQFQVIEILLLVDNVKTVYATEYGILTSNGEMGEFAADVESDNIVRLYFTPYTAGTYTIKLLRTTMLF